MPQLSELEQHYNNILILFDRFSILFLLIPVPFALKKIRNIQFPMKVFAYFLFTSLLLHISEHIHIWAVLKYDPYWEFMKSINIRDTNFFNIFYRLTSYIYLGIFYQLTLFQKKSEQSPIKNIAFGLCVVTIFIYFFIDGYNKFGTVNSILSRCFMIVLSLWSIKQIFKYQLNFRIWKNPFFLISLGILFPTAFTLILSFFSDTLHENDFILYVKTIIGRNIISLAGEILFALSFIYSKNAKVL